MVTAEGFTKLFNSLVFKGTNFTCDVVPIPNQKSVLVINYKLSNHFECLGGTDTENYRGIDEVDLLSALGGAVSYLATSFNEAIDFNFVYCIQDPENYKVISSIAEESLNTLKMNEGCKTQIHVSTRSYDEGGSYVYGLSRRSWSEGGPVIKSYYEKKYGKNNFLFVPRLMFKGDLETNKECDLNILYDYLQEVFPDFDKMSWETSLIKT